MRRTKFFLTFTRLDYMSALATPAVSGNATQGGAAGSGLHLHVHKQ